MNEQQLEKLKGLTLANEFLKILRGYKIESDRPDSMPEEVSVSLANAQLNHVMEKHGLDPEHLVWGLVQVIEMFLQMTDTEPETLSNAIDRFLEFVDEQEGKKNV